MSEIHPIVVPKWGLSMTEGTLAQWNVDVGAMVNSGDVVADIETEKIVNELEVRASGVLRRQLVSEGETVPVGGLLGIIASEGISDEAIEAFIREYAGEHSLTESTATETSTAAKPAATIVQPAKTSAGNTETRVPDGMMLAEGADNLDDANATHHAKRFANEWRVDLGRVAGSGRRGRVSLSDVKRAIASAGGAVGVAGSISAGTATVRATPLAKRLATQHGVDLASIVGSGSRGRITKHDVIAVTTATSDLVDHVPQASAFDSDGGVEVQLSNTRRVIARRLSESKRTAPHFRVATDIRIDDLLALREQLNHNGRAQRVSVTDMLVKAVAVALVEIPQVNVQYSGDVLRQYDDVDIAVAVALDDGLITPIVRQANRKDLGELSLETSDLIARAKSGTLRPEDIEGGTFTLSNLGMFGVSAFDAIINQPQVAILAVGAAEKKRVFVEDEELVSMVIRATLSCDHRIVDGALGARFMQFLKQTIEQPGRLLG